MDILNYVDRMKHFSVSLYYALNNVQVTHASAINLLLYFRKHLLKIGSNFLNRNS